MSANMFGFQPAINQLFERELNAVISHKVLVAKIRRQLEAFVPKLEDAFKSFEFIDQDKALKCMELSRQLLEICESDPESELVPYCLAAINYFIETNDVNPDFSTIDGFDDDFEVLDKIASHVKRKA